MNRKRILEINNIFEDLKMKFIDMCEEKNIDFRDEMLYMIFSEYPIGVINEELGNLNEIKNNLRDEYDTLWNMQPSLEEDEEKAFAIQHVRDMYDVLLGECGDAYLMDLKSYKEDI